MTWMLDDDFVGVLNEVNLLLKCGLPSGGWVAQMLKDNKHALRPIAKRNRARGTHEAISLDRAEREGHPSTHPDYDPRWYPRVEYAGIVLVDEEGNPVSDEEAVAS
jgi:hypothetical protein